MFHHALPGYDTVGVTSVVSQLIRTQLKQLHSSHQGSLMILPAFLDQLFHSQAITPVTMIAREFFVQN